MAETTFSILVVENEESDRSGLAAALVSAGYAVNDAENGVMGLELLKKKPYDVFLVDYKLPDMSGIDFIRHASLIARNSIPVIITAVNTLEVALDGMRAGAREYLTKPVNPEGLLKNIGQFVKERDEAIRGKVAVPGVLQRLALPENSAFEVLFEDSTLGQGQKYSPGMLVTVRDRLYDIMYALKKFFWNITN